MKNLLIFLLLIFIFACNNSKTGQVNTNDDKAKQNDLVWSVKVGVWGAPWDPEFKVHVANTRDSMIVYKYVYVNDSFNEKMIQKIDKRNAFRMSQSGKDSIYELTKQVFDNLKLPTSNPAQVSDGPKISIELKQNSVALECKFYNITHIENASPEIGKLVNFINNRLTKKDKIY